MRIDATPPMPLLLLLLLMLQNRGRRSYNTKGLYSSVSPRQ